MDLKTNIFLVMGYIAIFWTCIAILAFTVYGITRLISYAIFRSRLQVYFNLKTEERANGEKEEGQKEVVIQE